MNMKEGQKALLILRVREHGIEAIYNKYYSKKYKFNYFKQKFASIREEFKIPENSMNKEKSIMSTISDINEEELIAGLKIYPDETIKEITPMSNISKYLAGMLTIKDYKEMTNDEKKELLKYL